MAYLFRTFPWLFDAPLFHFLAMLFRRSSFQFYAYAIGLIAVPLQRFTIPLHCPAFQCRCHPMQFSSVAIPCLSMPLPIVTLLYNPRLFPNISPAVLVPSPLSSAHTVLFKAAPFPSNSYLLLALPLRFDALLFAAFACPGSAFPGHATAYLCSAFPMPFNSVLFPCPAIPRYSHAHQIVST